jgi:predicted alpha/beta superfamily hydrolase
MEMSSVIRMSLLAGCAVFLGATLALAEPITAQQRTDTLTLYSKILDEEREIYVLVPEDFDPGAKGYTTIYVLDGEWSFPMVSSYIDYLSRWKRIPNLIVTGVRNVDRNRDYIFAEDRSFPGTGGADQFQRFLAEEWAPTIEEKYNGSGKRILLGHSFGGAFALYSMMTAPDLFDAYIAVGSSTWVAQRGLFKVAEEFLRKPLQEKFFLYMAVAEADGGATVPDGIAFAELFEQTPNESIEWYFEVIEETNHFTAVMPALFKAIERLYPAWGMDKEVEEIALTQGAEVLDNWFQEKEADLGFRFLLPSMELEFLAVDLASKGHGRAAEIVMGELLDRNPDSFTSLYALGLVYGRQGRYREAIEPIDKASRLAREAGETPTLVARYEKALERTRELMAEEEQPSEPGN